MRRFRPAIFRPIMVAMWTLLLLVAVPAVAHHGWGSYDAERPARFDAAPTQVQYSNPHGQITVPYQGKAWTIILAPVSRMNARGLTEQMLTVGKTITVEAYPRTDGTAEMRAERVTVDGKTIELR